MGLSWDSFELLAEFMAESAGERAALLTQIGQSARAVAVVAATIASYMPFPIVGAAGELALYSLGEQSSSQMAVGVSLGLIPGGKLVKGLGGFVSRISGSALGVAKSYILRHGRPLIAAVLGPLASTVLKFIEKSALRSFDPYKAISSGLESIGKGYTRAGRDLLKHGNLIGMPNVQHAFGSNTSRINEAAHDLLTRIVGNLGSPEVAIRANGRVFVPLPGATNRLFGAVFEADGTFRNFGGKGL